MKNKKNIPVEENKSIEKVSVDKKSMPDIKKMFEVLEVMQENLQRGVCDIAAISSTYRVNPFLCQKIKKFLERSSSERNSRLADKAELVQNILLENITPEKIGKAKLSAIATAVQELDKVKHINRGNNTERIGIDWSNRPVDELLGYLKIKKQGVNVPADGQSCEIDGNPAKIETADNKE